MVFPEFAREESESIMFGPPSSVSITRDRERSVVHRFPGSNLFVDRPSLLSALIALIPRDSVHHAEVARTTIPLSCCRSLDFLMAFRFLKEKFLPEDSLRPSLRNVYPPDEASARSRVDQLSHLISACSYLSSPIPPYFPHRELYHVTLFSGLALP